MISDLAGKLLVSAAFTILIMAVVSFAGRWITWWAAAGVALLVVFGSMRIIDRRTRRRRWRA